MKTVERPPHVRLDERGRRWIDDTSLKVIEVVLDHLAYFEREVHSSAMTANSPTASAHEAADLSFGLASRHVRFFRAQVEDWYEVCRLLTDWEDRYLLDDPIPAARLAEHARLLDELERVGQWLLATAQSKDFPDQPTAELIAMTRRDLKDRRAMWHGPKMSEQRRAEILKACFNEP